MPNSIPANHSLPDTVALSSDGDAIVIIDQTVLPGKLCLLTLKSQDEIIEAIKTLRVRGAPAIGVTAAFGLYLASRSISSEYPNILYNEYILSLQNAKNALDASRPTAVNLSWALNKLFKIAEESACLTAPEITKLLRRAAEKIRDNDIASCKKIGENGLKLLGRGSGILTHCNAGHLAAVRYGTALAPIYLGNERGYGFSVFTDETRPLLQGMRLSAFELTYSGIDTTVICDNMASSIMRKGLVDAVIVGADRIAANGDTANKIGTSGVAILANHYGIPFYVAAPRSTFDPDTPCGDEIKIEERDRSEIGEMWFREKLIPDSAGAFNPAFDITDHSLITGYITDD